MIRLPFIQWNIKRTKCKEAISYGMVPRLRAAVGFVGLRQESGCLRASPRCSKRSSMRVSAEPSILGEASKHDPAPIVDRQIQAITFLP